MKNVYLIGDSIRFGSKNSPGYEVFVKVKLKDIVNVYSPNENCRFVQYTLRGLAEWIWEIDTNSIDIIHWNNGLWDVLRLDGDAPLTPIDVYLSMLERTYNKLRIYFPNAKIIFATTTKIIEEDAPKNWERRNQEIELYNKKAKELMLKLGVEINDLFAITNKFDKTHYADWTHPNEKGAEILAQAIVEKII